MTSLKIVFISLLMAMASTCAFCQQGMSVIIDQASSLNIHGKTNVNKFLCAQRETPDQDTVIVSMIENGEEVKLNNASLQIRINDFDCGIKQMTKEFRELLEAHKYPHLRMILNSFRRVKGSNEFMANITIVLAGEESSYTIPVQVHNDDRMLICSGKSQVSFVDFNLEPPVKFMGLVKVSEMLDISFNLIIRKLI